MIGSRTQFTHKTQDKSAHEHFECDDLWAFGMQGKKENIDW